MLERRQCILIVGLVGLLCARPAAAADRFLRPPSACPTNGDGSVYSCSSTAGGPGAFNSWSSANSAAKPGDTVRVDGQWDSASLLFFGADGTAASPIRITSYDPQKPALLRGTGSECVLYVEADHVVVDHLRFNSDLACCLVIGQEGPDAIHTAIEIRDNVFEQCRNGISVTYLDGAEIHDNDFQNIGDTASNQGHCIYFAQGSRKARAYRNRCAAKPNVLSSHCLHVYHSEPPGPAEDAEFHDNLCLGFTVGAGLYSGSKNIRVFGNTFIVKKDFGLTCRYGGSQAVFTNNIVFGDATYGAFIDDPACQLSVDYNIFHHTTGSFLFVLPGQSSNTWSDWQKLHDAHSSLADPQLVDAAAGDVHIKATSPARDHGDNNFVSTLDFYGAQRVIGGVVDIGAAEFVPPVSPEGRRAADAGGERAALPDGAEAGLPDRPSSNDGSSAERGGARLQAGCGCRMAPVPPAAGFGTLLALALLALLAAGRLKEVINPPRSGRHASAGVRESDRAGPPPGCRYRRR